MKRAIGVLGALFFAVISGCATTPSGQSYLAVAPFEYEGPNPPPPEISDIIESDLDRSGFFNIVPRQKLPVVIQDDAHVDFKFWRQSGIARLVAGSVRYLANGKYQVQFRLYDTSSGDQLTGYRYIQGPEDLRAAAHKISDVVHEALSGSPGAFSTQIAYVTESRSPQGITFFIKISDADGNNIRTIAKSKAPFRSLAWSPDGKTLAYWSLELGRPQIYLQNLATGMRELTADNPEINGPLAFSPDGRYLALAMSRDGTPGIYSHELATKKFKQLANNSAADTDLAWSPDGKFIVFTSSRAGKRRMYKLDVKEASVTQLSGEDHYSRAALAPDGRTLAIVTGDQSGQQLSIWRPDTGEVKPITRAAAIRSPSFAPNGQMLVYTTEADGRSVLATVSTNGRSNHILRAEKDNVRDLAWSPYLYLDRQ